MCKSLHIDCTMYFVILYVCMIEKKESVKVKLLRIHHLTITETVQFDLTAVFCRRNLLNRESTIGNR